MKIKLLPGFGVWVAASLLFAPALRADWSFAMLGDTRGEYGTTTTGVSAYLDAIAQKIASLNPELVLVAGDLVNGDDIHATSVLTNYALQFDNWKTAMQPVFNYATSTGIPIYPVRGNHENNCGEGAPIAALKQAYYDAFNAYVPLNGPNYSSTNNQIGYSYSFTHNNVTFAAADQYFYYDQTPGLTGYHDLARDWVAQQFAQTNSPFKLFMAHEPIFDTEHSTPGGFFGDTAGGLQTRADLWNAIGTNGVQLYLTGHVHNETVASTTNEYGNTIIQLLAGNGGAPLEAVGGSHEPGVDVLYTNGINFGFALATVSDTALTIQYHLLNTNDNSWSTASYTTTIAAVPEPSSVLLIAGGLSCLCAWRRRRKNS